MGQANAIADWFGGERPANIHIRFAFHEVESWLLADRQNLARFMNVSEAAFPIVRDDDVNAKELLVQLARRSRSREIIEEMVPQPGFTAAVGPAYNLRLSEFIQTTWDVRAAAAGNASLARACRRIAEIR